MSKYVIIKESFQSDLELGDVFPLEVDISEPGMFIDYSEDPYSTLSGIDINATAVAEALGISVDALIDDNRVVLLMLSYVGGAPYLYFYDYEVVING